MVHGSNRHVHVILLLISLAVLTGCVPRYRDFDAFLRVPQPLVGGKPYVIEPPDVIQLDAPGAPEIHNSQARVRPDGYVTLPLLGDVFSAGRTPTQLAAEIEEKVLMYYHDVTVQVLVVGFNSKFYYMAGETNMGPKAYTGKQTILDAVLDAGIPRTAWPEKLVVLRPNEDGELTRRMTIDFKDMIARGDLKYNAVIEEGDILFMPINPLAAIGVTIQNLLMPIDPLLSASVAPRRAATAFGVPNDQTLFW